MKFLLEELRKRYALDDAFVAALAAAQSTFPDLTRQEAAVLAEGDSAEIAALIAARPAVARVEEFLGQYVFGQ